VLAPSGSGTAGGLLHPPQAAKPFINDYGPDADKSFVATPGGSKNVASHVMWKDVPMAEVLEAIGQRDEICGVRLSEVHSFLQKSGGFKDIRASGYKGKLRTAYTAIRDRLQASDDPK
jgi:hypothetical protein